MIGAFALAIIVYLDLDQKGGVIAAIQASPQYSENTLQMFPAFGWNLDTATFLIMITVGWWIFAPGTGYFIQRTLATRSERDAMLGLYWFATCHYIIRSWPWIVVGIASIVYFPVLPDAEQSYPLMINEFLPVGLKGVMVASLLAAFMSTLDTQMNWGSSYLIVDFYKPFLAPGKSQHHYVWAARVAMLLLTLTAITVSTQLSGILSAYQYLAVVLSGTSFVLIARWYWWRITVWSEIASLVSSFVVGNTLLFLVPDTDQEQWFAVRLLINLLLTTSVCLIVTFATSRHGPAGQAIDFFVRIRVPGRGWSRVSNICGIDAEPIGFFDCFLGAVGSIAGLFGLLLCIGELVLGSPVNAMLYGVISAAGISISISRFRAIIRPQVPVDYSLRHR
jgi:SSS family solute:Na+ symporter